MKLMNEKGQNSVGLGIIIGVLGLGLLLLGAWVIFRSPVQQVYPPPQYNQQPQELPVIVEQGAQVQVANPPTFSASIPVNDSATRVAQQVSQQQTLIAQQNQQVQQLQIVPSPTNAPAALFEVITCARTAWFDRPIQDAKYAKGYIAHATKLTVEARSPDMNWVKLYAPGLNVEMWVPVRDLNIQGGPCAPQ